MKRSKIYLVLILVSTLFLFDGCAKKTENKADDCTTLAQKASDAADAFVVSQTEATCEAYVQSIQDYYNGCDLIPAATKQSYDAWLASIDCSYYGEGK